MEKYWLKEENQAAFEFARILTRNYAKSFYVSARFLPLQRRWATFALYGFCRYVDNLIDIPRSRTQQDLLDEVNSLRDELSKAYRSGESEHPVLKPFMIVARRTGIPIEYPMALLSGVEMDISISGYENFDELYVFCYRVAGVVGLMMTHVLGYKNPSAFEYAEKLGIAMQLTNILRDIQEDQRMGRIYLPRQEMKQFGVTPLDLHNERMTPELQQLIKFQVERAQRYYNKANRGIPFLKTESQFAIYSASRIYNTILKNIQERDYNAFLGRVIVPNRRKLGILLIEVMRKNLLTLQEKLIPLQGTSAP